MAQRSRWLLLAFLGGCVQTHHVEVAPTAQLDENPVARKVRLSTELAGGYFARGQYDVALEELNKALKLDANYAPAHNVAGLVYMELKEDARAESEFQRALQLAPNDGDIHNNFGWFLCQRNREKQALEQFDLAVRNTLYRTPEVAYVNAGLCSARVGEINAAQDFYRRALTVQPYNVPANLGLAELSYKAAQYQQAQSYLLSAFSNAKAPSAEAYYLGVCVERKLNNRKTELNLLEQMRARYPNADETAKLANGGCE